MKSIKFIATSILFIFLLTTMNGQIIRPSSTDEDMVKTREEKNAVLINSKLKIEQKNGLIQEEDDDDRDEDTDLKKSGTKKKSENIKATKNTKKLRAIKKSKKSKIEE